MYEGYFAIGTALELFDYWIGRFTDVSTTDKTGASRLLRQLAADPLSSPKPIEMPATIATKKSVGDMVRRRNANRTREAGQMPGKVVRTKAFRRRTNMVPGACG